MAAMASAGGGNGISEKRSAAKKISAAYQMA
jgi:hypothetical protein